MLAFSDHPYQFFEARPSAVFSPVLRWLNRVHLLPRREKIAGVEVSGAELPREALDAKGAVVLCPNHPTHSDAAIFSEALRTRRFPSRFMAAYDVFLRGKFDAWAMQRMGAFSVDREGSDRRSMKEALRVLTDLPTSLTIFPEGNVYLQNDELTPFNEGAAFLALQAAKRLSKEGRPSLIVPVSIKATYLDDVRPQLNERLQTLAGRLGIESHPETPPGTWVKDLGAAGLRRSLKAEGIDLPPGDDIRAMISAGAGVVLARLEKKIGIEPKAAQSALDRVRVARRKIHDIRIDQEKEIDHAAARGWADEAMLAFRIASYGGTYLRGAPTIDRIAETVEKLEEDLYDRRPEPFADRLAFVRFGKPIDAVPFLAQKKAGIAALTAEVEAEVQAGIDQINANNPHAGGRSWEG